MLNIIHHQGKFDEKLSIDTPAKSGNNGILTQNLQAVTPNGLNWLFYCLSYTLNPVDLRPFMLWLILQNKPIGEYAKRLLVRPRVRPQRPFMGYLLKTLQGASLC